MLLDNYFYNLNYNIIFNFIIISVLLVIFLIVLSSMLSPNITSFEKHSAYECGFEPFGNAKKIIDIQFYIIAVLFLIFDLEIVLLFPWIYYINFYTFFHYLIMIFFISLLTLGFIYEWKKGVLDWV